MSGIWVSYLGCLRKCLWEMWFCGTQWPGRVWWMVLFDSMPKTKRDIIKWSHGAVQGRENGVGTVGFREDGGEKWGFLKFYGFGTCKSCEDCSVYFLLDAGEIVIFYGLFWVLFYNGFKLFIWIFFLWAWDYFVNK